MTTPGQREDERIARASELAERRLAAFANADAAIARLRELAMPSAILGAAPAKLGAASEFTRIVLSSVRDGVMTAEAVWSRDDHRAAVRTLEALRAAPTELVHPLAETEVVRRKRAILVNAAPNGPGVHAPAHAAIGWDAYVAAPVLAGSAVIAILHADRGAGGRVGDEHRQLLWEFAAGLGMAYEAASLRRTLRRERRALRTLLNWLDDRSGDIADAPIRLDAVDAPDAAVPALESGSAGASPGTVDTLVFDGLLTRRELEVLRLMSEGRTNGGIANDLVISIGTVKFHVNRILTKLHVANRTEAVARYYALVGLTMRD